MTPPPFKGEPSIAVMPDPRWRPDHAKKGAAKVPHPCIAVVAVVGEDGALYIWDEILGFRRAK